MLQPFSKRLDLDAQLSQILRRQAQPFTGEASELDSLMEMIGEHRFVLIGEASHGTHEFYKTRVDLTKRLIEEKGFNVIAAEADWPDSWMVNRFVKDLGPAHRAYDSLSSFKRFPTWLWRNADVLSFVEWLKYHNDKTSNYDDKVGFYGLDLYSLYRSASAVISYLEQIDPEAAERARGRYSCLSEFGFNEQAYGYASSLGLTKACEEKIVAQLIDLKRKESECLRRDGSIASDEFFFAEQNARIVAKAQAYYREMFRSRTGSWNLRDLHMMEVLTALDEHLHKHGRKMKVVVWAHNSHLGDARATHMGSQGELNLGQLVRERFPHECCLIGFTGYSGTVTAASTWGGPAERKTVRPALLESYEQLFHTVDLPAFILPLKDRELRGLLRHPRLQRAIGVIYSPETERVSHYFHSRMAEQFDAVIHFQETQAVEPLEKLPQWIAGEDRVEDTID